MIGIEQKAIWQFTLSLTGVQTIKMPENANIIHLEVQYNELNIWAIVDTKALKEERTFSMYGTGRLLEVAEEEKHIGSFQMSGGSLVFHVFERINTKEKAE